MSLVAILGNAKAVVTFDSCSWTYGMPGEIMYCPDNSAVIAGYCSGGCGPANNTAGVTTSQMLYEMGIFL